jgi:hypothetical protein
MTVNLVVAQKNGSTHTCSRVGAMLQWRPADSLIITTQQGNDAPHTRSIPGGCYSHGPGDRQGGPRTLRGYGPTAPGSVGTATLYPEIAVAGHTASIVGQVEAACLR